MSPTLEPCIPSNGVALHVEAVAFDFDGTLADTTGAIVNTALQTLRELELPSVPPETFVAMIGLPLRQAFIGAGVAPEAADACVVHYRACFPANARAVTLFPAVRECLEELTRQGRRLGIVSSRGRASLLELLDRLQIRAHFRQVLGDEDVLRKKPEPDLVHMLGTRLQIAPARMLVVGDTTYDIEMGHAAGAATCAVTYGSHDGARLQAARPTYQLDSLSGLGALLAR
ncbi:MAG: HAD family hydrolase [Myxococcales bacterium]